MTQALSRYIGNESDERFLEKTEELGVDMELYERYVDDQNIAGWSIGRTVEFCPEAGKMQIKSDDVIEYEKDKRDDELFMKELRKIADTVMDMLSTEEDSPAQHPELGFKVPILDVAVWVEEARLPPPGMEGQGQENINIHTKCRGRTCLPIGELNPELQGLEAPPEPATRMVQQINYDFFSKPSAPKQTILLSSANPWQQKRTAFTQEVIRRLLRTRKEQNCDKKQKILTNYMQILKNSGYDKGFRTEILRAGVKGYNKILQDAKNGLKPIYRTKEWRKSARRMDKQKKKV